MKKILFALSIIFINAAFAQKTDEEKITFNDVKTPLKPIKTVKTYNFTVVTPYPENNNSVREFAQKKYQDELANYPNVVAESERKYQEELKKHEQDVEAARENFKIETDAYNKLSIVERMALKDQKPVLRLPSKPVYYKPAEPRFMEPDLSRSIVFDPKILSSLHLKLHGYEKGTDQALNGKITLQSFESTPTETKTREVSTYDKASGKSVTRLEYYYVATYRRLVEIVLDHNGQTIYDGILESSKEFIEYKGSTPPNMFAIEKKSVDDALMAANLYINDNYGFTPVEVKREVYFVKNKSEEYDDVEKAKKFAVSGYAGFKQGVKNTDLEEAIQMWLKILKESDLEDKKARIDEKVTRILLINVIEAAITVNDFKTAEAQIKIYESLKNDKGERAILDNLKKLYEDRKARFDAAQ